MTSFSDLDPDSSLRFRMLTFFSDGLVLSLPFLELEAYFNSLNMTRFETLPRSFEPSDSRPASVLFSHDVRTCIIKPDTTKPVGLKFESEVM